MYSEDIGLAKLQNKVLEIALYFDEFCSSHDLLCYMCGGGCIGAVRHKGFIPWDDDIDFFMPRSDYEKLKQIWQDTDRFCIAYPTEHYNDHNIFITIRDRTTTMIKPYQAGLDIVHGISIDVFPIDGCPDGLIRRSSQLMWALLYQLYCAQMVPENHGRLVAATGRLMLSLVKSAKSRYKIWRHAENKMSRYSLSASRYMTELCAGPHYMRNKYPADAFKASRRIQFEDANLPVPEGYDDYLRIAFGDYMQLPPEEKRVPQHDALLVDTERSYPNCTVYDIPSISIIVPVYMAATHLQRCVNSLLSQTMDNIEIILVDDGSPDESGSLCDRYSEQDPRVRVIHKDNGGPSDARNAGLDAAIGHYIGFVDSDDYVDPDMFEYLYLLAGKYDADIAGCRIRDVYGDFPSKHIDGKIEKERITAHDGIDSVRYVLEWGTDMYAFNKIYRREMLDGLRFRKGRLFEDAWLMVDIFSRADKTVFSTLSKYNHCHREDSITAASYDPRFRDVLDAHDYNYIRATELSPELEAAADVRRCWARFYLLDKMLLSGYKDQGEINELLRFLKARKRRIFASKQFGAPRKIAFSALLLSRKLYYPFVLGQNAIERRK